MSINKTKLQKDGANGITKISSWKGSKKTFLKEKIGLPALLYVVIPEVSNLTHLFVKRLKNRHAFYWSVKISYYY